MAMPSPSYVYRARLVSVTDGDTVVVERDLGDHLYQQTAVRLLGLNCPEIHGASKTAGDAATTFTRDWMRQGVALDPWPLVIETHLDKREKYGRLLACVWRVADGRELNADLIAGGHAVPFMAEAR